ncbi:double-strand break repair helicase AddA [uncultured Bartonella sp.]|uniref:double-strand break repair helicase AddA n=1 Tax=uncultured Bartonella sp. TaxID=104108 RepID=UPI002631C60C|nr:double-strand break repair helicase AddA [uncultured Bartonella sp.]
MSFPNIPKQALDPQSEAAHPKNNVWVSANAGSGKTHVLTERVIRLLLNGTEPARILCLTYTKAAAAVMQTRIFRRLSAWTELADGQLSTILFQLEGRKPDARRLDEARRLFARALETPGGLKIQTIHAFCERLLHQFPLEANIAGHFELMDELERDALLQKARRYVLENAYLQKDSLLHESLLQVLKAAGESGLDNLLSEAIEKRQALMPFLKRVVGKNGQKILESLLQISPEDTEKKLVGEIRAVARHRPEIIIALRDLGHSHSQDFAGRLELLQTADDDELLEIVNLAYFTKGKPRTIKNLASKKLLEALPGLQNDLELRQEKLAVLFDKLQRVRSVALNLAAFRLCYRLLIRYENLKKAKGVLDFDDLIDRSLNLLKREGAGQWVQYKLDRGIDHILVDEAQDTSPAQWQIVQLLAQEFFVGEGQREVERTVFAVGDEKQSIYSFQGAVPEDFDANGRLIEKKAKAAHQPFRRIKLNFSFRSTKDVLQSVDLVFEKPENYKGLSAENIKTVHEAIRVNDPGEVVIWESLTPNIVEEPEDWREPVDQLHAPAVKLAEEIATTIHHWLSSNEMLPGQGRKVRASDIIVLVRKRDQFVPALARALKNRDVPVAGADRLRLTNHIAVQDLMALARFVLQPKDDLSLAAVLKSPLFGFDENDIYHLATDRNGTLFESLKSQASEKKHYESALTLLRKYRNLADKSPVFEFFSHILSEDQGRAKILARLGSEASDVLDAFMDYALSVQKTGLPGLQAFLETIVASDPEIKRELDQNREEIRIMTVHAAKGLESAIVFLVDSGSRIWNSRHEPKLIEIATGQTNGFLWQPSKDFQTSFGESYIDQLKEKAEEEYRRLLYVGMTRAEDRLIVCGYRGKNYVDGTWSSLVGAALKPHSVEISGPTPTIKAWLYCADEKRGSREKVADQGEHELAIEPLPAYFQRAMAPETDLPKPLTPSGASLDIDENTVANHKKMNISPVFEGKTKDASLAIKRGTIIHRLLQYLPQGNEHNRQALARAYLAKVAPEWSDAQRREAFRQTFDVMANPLLQPLFAKEARAEVSLMGIVEIKGKKYAVSGQIDRLNDSENSIVLADFKTGRAPGREQDIPDSYLLQMALYRHLLQAIHPEKSIQTLLVYTSGPKVFELDGKKLACILEKEKNNPIRL